MASTLKINNLDSASGTTITVPTGKKLVVTDAGGMQVPHMVGQMVQSGTIADHNNSAEATWANTNYTLAITPTATSSKVLVHFHIPYRLSGTGTNMRGSMRLNRAISGGATTLVWNTDSNVEQFQVRNATNEHDAIMSMTFLDSPSTTNAVTYTMQSYRHNDSGMSFIYTYGASRGGNVLLQEILQ